MNGACLCVSVYVVACLCLCACGREWGHWTGDDIRECKTHGVVMEVFYMILRWSEMSQSSPTGILPQSNT